MKKEQPKKIDVGLADLGRQTKDTIKKVMGNLAGIRETVEKKKGYHQHRERIWPPLVEALPAVESRIRGYAAQYDIFNFIHDGNPVIAESIDRKMDRVLEFICCVLGDEVLKNIATKLRESWPKETLAAADRAASLAALAAEIRELETEEELICCQLEEFGVTIDRRPDLSPEVFLEVREEDEKN